MNFIYSYLSFIIFFCFFLLLTSLVLGFLVSATTNNNDNRNINSKKDTNNTPLKTDERAIKDMKNEDLYQAGLTAAEKLKSQLETTLLLYQHIVERASSVTDSVNVQIWKNTRTQLEDTFAAVQNELKNPLQSKPQY